MARLNLVVTQRRSRELPHVLGSPRRGECLLSHCRAKWLPSYRLASLADALALISNQKIAILI